MKLLITASSLEKCEEMLNQHYYSTTYKIIEDKVYFKNPLEENTSLAFKMKGKKHQIYINL